MAEWQQIAFKRIGDDVSGDFAFNDTIADFSDSFASYANLADAQEFWPNIGTKIIVNVSTDVIDWDSQLDGTNNAVDYDLWRFGIFPSDTNWTLRFKLVIETNDGSGSAGKLLTVGLNNSNRFVDSTQNQDFINIRLSTNNSFPGGRIHLEVGENDPILSGQNIIFGEVTNLGGFPQQWFVELKRTAVDHAEATLYTDADFTQIFEKVRISGTNLNASLNDLRYIKLQNRLLGAEAGSQTGTVTNIQFFNDTEGVQDFIAIKGDLTAEDINEDWSSYTTEHAQTVFFDFTDATGWTEEDSTRARIETLLGLLTVSNVQRDGTNDNLIYDLGLAIQPPTDFEDDFANASKWSQFGSEIFISGGVLNADDFDPDFGVDSVSHDFGVAQQDLWVLRFKWTLTTAVNPSVGAKVFVGLSSVDGSAPVSTLQDGMNISMDYSSIGLFRFVTNWGDNEAYNVNGSLVINLPNSPPNTPQTWYVEFVRLHNTAMKVTLYNNANFTDVFATQTRGTGALANLQYIRITNTNVSGSDGFRSDIDDLQYWDGINSLDIGALSDENWLATFKLSILNNVFASNQLDSAFGAFDMDSTVGGTTAQDGMYFGIGNEGGQNRFKVSVADGVDLFSPTDSIGFTTPADPGLYYVKLFRIGDSVRVGLYRDSLFNDLIEEQTASLPFQSGDAVTSLRWFGYKNRDDSVAVGTCGYRIDDLAIYNGVSVAKEPLEDPASFSDDFVYADQATADTAWPFNVTTQKVDQPNENLKFLIQRNGVNNAVAHDLGAPVSDNWTLRFKWLPTTYVPTGVLSASCIVSLSADDQTVGLGGATDYVGIFFDDNSATPAIVFLGAEDGGTPTGFASLGASMWDANIPLYAELRRDSATKLTARLFYDPDYQVLKASATSTIPATITGLQYIKVYSPDDNTGYNGTTEGIIDNIQFWDGEFGQSSQNTWVTSVQNTDARWLIDLQEQRVFFNTLVDGNNNQIARDLGSPVSDTAWVMRFTQRIDSQVAGNSQGKYAWIGLWDSDQESNSQSSQSRIDLFFLTGSGASLGNYALNAGDSVIVSNGGTNAVFDEHTNTRLGVDVYWELIRIDADSCRLNMFRDADYTDLIESETIGAGNDVSPTLTGLQFIKVMSRDLTPGTGSQTGHFRDIEIWDGVNVVDGFATTDSLQLQAFIKQTDGALRPLGQFNADERNLYNIRQNFGYTGGDVLTTFTSYLVQGSSTSDDRFFYIQLTNTILEEILGEHRMVHRGALGSGTAPNVTEGVANWDNVLERITRMFWPQDQAGSYDTDTAFVLFGSD